MRKQLYHWASVTAVAFIMAGCAQPAVTPNPIAFQERENRARDWTAVAHRIAGGMAERGLLPGVVPATPSATQAPTVLPQDPFYIHVVAPGSTFLQEVRDGLEREILARGGAISRSPTRSIVVNLDIDVVHWSSDRGPEGIGTAAGLAAGTGVLLASGGPYSPAAAFGMAAGAGIAADTIWALSPRTNVEAIWKASVMRSDVVVMVDRAPVYIRPGDIPLYASQMHLSPIESSTPETARTAVQLRYAP